MTHAGILQLLYDETLVGNAPAVREGVESGLRDDLGPERMLYELATFLLGTVNGRRPRQEYPDAVGADGYSAAASSAVKKAKGLPAQRDAPVAA